MNIFNTVYSTGRQIRRDGGSASDCQNSEMVNGFWREDQEIARQNRKPKTYLHLLVKPQAAGHIGFRAA